MATRSILGLIYTLQALQRLSAPVDAILKRHGMTLSQLDPSAEIERSLELEILGEAIEHIDDPLAGFHMGNQFSLAGYGPFTMLLMTCATAWEAFKTGEKYQELGYMFAHMALEPGATHTALTLYPATLPDKLRRFLIDRDFTGTFRLIMDLQVQMGINLRPREVWLAFEEGTHRKVYEDYYGCKVHFGSDASRALIDNQHLQLPFPSASKTAHSLYISQCDQLLAKRQQHTDHLASKVARHLAMFTGCFPSAAEVARTFSIPERSFRRQLSQEKRSFQKILDDTRMHKACQWLADSSQSVEAIGLQLGYAEAASFIHAFQRWTGATPAAWRKTHKAG